MEEIMKLMVKEHTQKMTSTYKSNILSALAVPDSLFSHDVVSNSQIEYYYITSYTRELGNV